MQLVIDATKTCSCGFDDSAAMSAPEHFQNPLAVLGQIRDTCPCHWSKTLGGWLFTGYEDVDWCLRSPELFSSRFHTLRQVESLPPHLRELARPLIDVLDGQMIMMQDPPQHTQQRRVLYPAFRPGHIATLDAGMREITQSLLASVAGDGGCDFLNAIARPLPGQLLCDFLGVPRSDQPMFVGWGQAVANFVVNPTGDDVVANAMKAFDDMADYIEALLERRRAEADESVDLIRLLVEAEQNGQRLSHGEIVATCVQMLFAGHTTSTASLVMMVYLLATHPDQQQLLREQPELIPNAIEEMFRYSGPVEIIPARTAVQTIERHGQTIREGEAVFVALGPAGRDPRLFDQPDEFDVTRKYVRQLQFGAGPHFCIGAPVTRLEVKVALEEMLATIPTFRLATDELHWEPVHVLRMPEALPLTW